jgi:hypothetical protein
MVQGFPNVIKLTNTGSHFFALYYLIEVHFGHLKIQQINLTVMKTSVLRQALF